MFVGIEFDESVNDGDGGVALVNKSWLTPRKREVFWPPCKQQHEYDKLVKKAETPVDILSWKLYAVKRSFFESDDYVKALKKLKQSEITSDIQTDVENQSLKRKIRQPRRILHDTSDEDTTGSDCTERKIQKKSAVSRPPRINFQRRNETESSITLEHESSIGQCTPQSQLRHTASFHTHKSSTPSTSVLDDLDQTFESPGLKKIFGLLSAIKEQNSQILSWTKNQSAPIASDRVILDNLPVSLPLDSQINLESFEDFLKNSSNCTSLSTYLSSLGGRELTSKTNRVLKYLLTDQLAAAYSFYGKRLNKKPFHELLLCSVIVRAVKSNSSHTDKAIEDCIKIWLKHAPQRFKTTESKQAALPGKN